MVGRKMGTVLKTHAAPLQARGGVAAFELVEADRIDAQARPKEPAFLMWVSRSGDRPQRGRDRPQRCDAGRGRRDAAAVVAGDFASSNAGVFLAHRGESCRPGVVSIEPEHGGRCPLFKASGSEAEGLEARLR